MRCRRRAVIEQSGHAGIRNRTDAQRSGHLHRAPPSQRRHLRPGVQSPDSLGREAADTLAQTSCTGPSSKLEEPAANLSVDRVGGAAALAMLTLLFPGVSSSHGTTCSQPVALDPSYAPDHQNYLCMNYTRPTPLPCRDSAQGWAPRWFDGKGRPRFIIYAYSRKSKLAPRQCCAPWLRPRAAHPPEPPARLSRLPA